MLSMGCTTDLHKLWAHLKRPKALAVGMACQLGVMPLVAIILGLSFSLNPTSAIAVLVMGSSPGGIVSNLISYWTDGDMDLSIIMTVSSTILVVGLIPLYLYLYCISTNITNISTPESNVSTYPASVMVISTKEGNIRIPFEQIGIGLVTLIIPIAFGILFKRKWPKQAKIFLKMGSAVSAGLLIILTLITSVLHKGQWGTDLSLLVIGIINPFIGYLAGFTVAVILRLSWQRCRTIAIETGTQNGYLCATILLISFEDHLELQRSLAAYPLIYICCQIFYGFLIAAAYQLYQRQNSNHFQISALFTKGKKKMNVSSGENSEKLSQPNQATTEMLEPVLHQRLVDSTEETDFNSQPFISN
ncbi:solute carrier family 10 member 6 isoform X1 [Callorhinchus milii]|nr:solute carrier family 10 member 6 isoform X1 [Callorhinchus milii]|eukprot:gi/632958592/ref/XP_007895130.1/ PREDICTED: solute carrier family 10 member 6 isoform X1 [Callorhinchus milii]